MNSKTVLEIPLEKIFANPDQPRKHFDESKLQELSMSINEHGVQEPIKVVRRNGGYMIVMGERRFRASRLADKKTIPAIIDDLTSEQIEYLALIENLQREDLNVIEEANAFKSLLDKGLTKEELSKKLGFVQTWRIDEKLTFLNLLPEYQDMLIGKSKYTLTPLQALKVSLLPHEHQRLVVNKIINGELNTLNKLRAFVNALLITERQIECFALTPLTDTEKDSISMFSDLISHIEKFICKVNDGKTIKHLQKVVFHSNVNADRLDLIISTLQKIRKTILVGEGLQNVLTEKG